MRTRSKIISILDERVAVPLAVAAAQRRAAEYRHEMQKRNLQRKKQEEQERRSRFSKRDARLEAFLKQKRGESREAFVLKERENKEAFVLKERENREVFPKERESRVEVFPKERQDKDVYSTLGARVEDRRTRSIKQERQNGDFYSTLVERNTSCNSKNSGLHSVRSGSLSRGGSSADTSIIFSKTTA